MTKPDIGDHIFANFFGSLASTQTKATMLDFARFFEIANKHNLTHSDCERIAQVEMGKKLTEFTKEELKAFSERICGVDQT